MWRVGIVDRVEGTLLRDAREHLARLPLILEPYRSGVSYDAVVLAEGASCPEPLLGRMVVLPGGSNQPLNADLALSYGMTESDTVTLAAGRHTCIVSLRRDIPGFSGGWVCRQDAVLDLHPENGQPDALPPSRVLPLAALRFLCAAN